MKLMGALAHCAWRAVRCFCYCPFITLFSCVCVKYTCLVSFDFLCVPFVAVCFSAAKCMNGGDWVAGDFSFL